MRRIRWGVIGSGGIAQRRTIPEGIVPAHNAQLVAVYNPSQDVNQRVASQFGGRACRSVEELLESGVEAVYLGSPPDVHLEQVRQCAAAGRHILCEKPLGRSVAEVREMLEVCRVARVHLGTAFMMRFQSQHVAAWQLVQAGRLGRPVLARAQLSCWYPPLAGAWRQDLARSGGGSLIDMGGHCIDLLEMFFGPVSAVSCVTQRTIHDYAPEDSAVVTLVFANGATGVVDAFFCIPDEASLNVLELYGTRGSILAQGTIGQESQGRMVARLGGQDGIYDPRQSRDGRAGVVIDPAPVNTYQAEIEDFSAAILEHRPPALSAALGLRSQEVLAACYESARLKRTISVN